MPGGLIAESMGTIPGGNRIRFTRPHPSAPVRNGRQSGESRTLDSIHDSNYSSAGIIKSIGSIRNHDNATYVNKYFV